MNNLNFNSPAVMTQKKKAGVTQRNPPAVLGPLVSDNYFLQEVSTTDSRAMKTSTLACLEATSQHCEHDWLDMAATCGVKT